MIGTGRHGVGKEGVDLCGKQACQILSPIFHPALLTFSVQMVEKQHIRA